MNKAAKFLIQATWMQDNPLFQNYDEVNQLDWNAIEAMHACTDSDSEIVMIEVLMYLCDKETNITLDFIGDLSHEERNAVIEALKMHWNGLQIEENL